MATITVTKGYNDPTGFTSGETITPAKLNSAQSPTVAIAFDTAADTDDSTLEVSGGKFRLKDGGVATAKLADSGVTPAKLAQPMTLATAQATTSGTSIDFTGIPSWVKRITVMLNGVSTSGTSNLLIQLGDAGGIEDTGYAGASVFAGNGTASTGSTFTTGFGVVTGAAANLLHGSILIHAVGGNLWVASGSYALSGSAFAASTAGSKTLSDTLTQVRLTTVSGGDTFDAGSVNIMYEG